MAATKSSAGTIREHTSRNGRRTFTCTIRVGKFKSASKTFASKREAREWAKQTKDLLARQRTGMRAARSDVTQLTVGDLLLEYLKDPETQQQRSFDGTHAMASWWVQEIGTTRVLDVNVLTLRDARDKLRKGRKATTVNRYIIVMRACWNWGRDAGLVPAEKAWPERLSLSEPKGRTRFLSDAEIAALQKASRGHSQLMATAITVSIATGLRRGELLRLKWSDVDLTRQIASITVTKTDKPRQVHLTQAACDALRALQAEKVRAIDGAVFTSPDGARLRDSTLEARWRIVRRAAGLEKSDLRWHDLRHTCASVLAQSGATLLEIASVLGHTSYASTKRYSHLVQGAALPAHAALDRKLGGGRDGGRE